MPHSKRLCLEQLERRAMLSISVDILDRTLLIRGTNGPDIVTVSGPNNAMQIEVADGSSTRAIDPQTFDRIAFFGLAGNDSFSNHTPTPTRAFGNGGDDSLRGGTGPNQLFGDAGIQPTLSVSLNHLNYVRNEFGSMTVGSTEHGDLDNDGLVSLADLNLVRNSFDRTIDASILPYGNDQLLGGPMTDVLVGDSGDDTFFGYDGDDNIDGGEGVDNLNGGGGADSMFGGPSDDTLNGDDGHDLIYGEGGEDVLQGGGDDDYANGGLGNDKLFGQSGNDYLVGHLGNDELDGGGGDDSLIGEDEIDSPINQADVFHLTEGNYFTAGSFSIAPDPTEGEGLGLIGRSHVDLVPRFTGSWTSAQRAAVNFALGIWENALVAEYSGEKIEIDFERKDLGRNAAGALILQSTGNARDAVGRVTYPSALANHIAGKDIHPGVAEMAISMTTNAGIAWYDGLDGNPARNQHEIVSVVLHEVAHGLGFDPDDIVTRQSANRHTCKWYEFNCTETVDLRSIVSIYATNMEFRLPSGTSKAISSLSQSEYNTARISNRVYWTGEAGIDRNLGGTIQMFAPPAFLGGSSMSHVDPSTTNNSVTSGDFLMFPGIGAGTVRRLSATEAGMLEDMGWDIDYQELIDQPGDITGTGERMRVATGDFNGDGADDVVMGFPYASFNLRESAGAIIVLASSRAGGLGVTPLIGHQGSASTDRLILSGSAENGDNFGYSLAVGDFNGDGRDDLAIGVPGEDVGNVSNAGAVNIVYGSASGLLGGAETIVDQGGVRGDGDIAGSVEQDDFFGASVAVGDFNGDGYDDLAIGVPGEDFGSATNAGASNILLGSAGGLRSSGNFTLDQDVAGINGRAETSDEFGSSLASGDFNGDGFDDLAVGVPGEDVGDSNSAGAVNIIYGSHDALVSGGNSIIDQGGGINFGDIHGDVEAGDRFGETLAVGDFNGDHFDDLAVGVPTEDFGDISEAGAVNIVLGSVQGLTPSGNFIIDQTGGRAFGDIEGSAEAFDYLGDALAIGDFDHDGFADIAIGVPFEDIGNKTNAGAVNIVHGSSSGLSPGRNYAIDQDGGRGWTGDLEGRSESGDLFGESLAVGDVNGDGYDDLVVAVAFEDIGELLDRGMISVIYGDSGGLTPRGDETWYLT